MHLRIAPLLLCLATLVFAPRTTRAESSVSSVPHELQLGLNLRTDLGVHFARLDAGWRRGRIGVLLVVDPMFWTDQQTFTDLLVFYMGNVIQPFAGWRLATIPLADGPQLQENLLLGFGIPFPRMLGGRIGGQFGLELAMMLFKHGGGLPGESIRFTSGRYYIDFINFGMYARFHYNVGL